MNLERYKKNALRARVEGGEDTTRWQVYEISMESS